MLALSREQLQGQLTTFHPLQTQVSCLTCTVSEVGSSWVLSHLFHWPLDAGNRSMCICSFTTGQESSLLYVIQALVPIRLSATRFNSAHQQKLDEQFFFWVCFLPGYLAALPYVWQEPNQHKRAAPLAHCLLVLQLRGLLITTAEEALLIARQKNN